MVAGSCGIETNRVVHYKPLLDEAIELANHKPSACIVLQRPQEPGKLIPGRDIGWAEAVAAAEPADCVPVAATDPLYILYTSGTTGIPKGVVRDNGGHAVALTWSMANVYGVKAGEVFWAASDVGWVVGHSYIVYAPLLAGCTTILYEGKPVGTPDAGAFWRVVEQHGVSVLFTAPTAFRAIKRDDPNAEHLKRYNIKSLRALFLAGERCDPDTLQWAERILQVPVIDHWWQTETGWAIAANCIGIEQLPVKPGSPTRAVPGYGVEVLDDAGEPVKPGDIGRIMIRLPMPPACLPTLWGNEERFFQSYLSAQPGYYLTGDAGYIDEDGYVFVMSRIDDIINVAGHRLSTGAMEAALAGHPDVAECAVIGAADQLKGELPLGLVVLKSGVDRDAKVIQKELVNKVRDEIGPVAAFKTVAIVQRLPKTRSGKILRGTMKSIADGKDYKVPATIDDPQILEEIAVGACRDRVRPARLGAALREGPDRLQRGLRALPAVRLPLAPALAGREIGQRPFRHDGPDGVQDVGEQVGVPGLLAGQQGLHVLPPGGHGKTGGAAIRDDRESGLAGVVGGLALPAIGQGANDADIALVVDVVGLHGAELPTVEDGKEQALGQVIQMLAQRQDVVAVLPADAVHDAALHAGAIGAEGIPAHMAAGLLHQGLALVVPGNAQGAVMVRQVARVEARYLRVHGQSRELEAHRGIGLKVPQDLQERKGILAAGDPEQDAVAFPDHTKVHNGPADVAEQRLRWLGDRSFGHWGEADMTLVGDWIESERPALSPALLRGRLRAQPHRGCLRSLTFGDQCSR